MTQVKEVLLIAVFVKLIHLIRPRLFVLDAIQEELHMELPLVIQGRGVHQVKDQSLKRTLGTVKLVQTNVELV